MGNPYTGEVELSLGGVACKLVYDWRALSELQTTFSEEVLANLFAVEPVAFAKIVAIGLQKHNPEMTQERILEQSPPLLSMQKAVNLALTYAYYGPDHLKPLEELAAEPEPAKKKSKWTALLRLSKAHS